MCVYVRVKTHTRMQTLVVFQLRVFPTCVHARKSLNQNKILFKFYSSIKNFFVRTRTWEKRKAAFNIQMFVFCICIAI